MQFVSSEGVPAMRKVSILIIVCLLSLPLLAQQPAGSAAKNPAQSATQPLPPDAPSREEVLQLFDLLQIKKLTETTMQMAQEQAKNVAEQMLREAMPDPTPDQLKSSQQLMDTITQDVMKAFPLDEMLNVMVPVYQRHLTRSDLQAIMAFYSSAVGQKLLREQPAMVQESMQAMAPLQQRMMEDLMRRMREQVVRNLHPKTQEKPKNSKS